MRCQPGSGSGSTSETPWTTATASATSPENKSGPSSAELTPLATDVIQRFDAGGRAICGGTPAARVSPFRLAVNQGGAGRAIRPPRSTPLSILPSMNVLRTKPLPLWVTWLATSAYPPQGRETIEEFVAGQALIATLP